MTPPTVPNPPVDAQIALTHADVAHTAGFNGQGVVIGIVDTGVSRNHPALTGRVTANLNYVDSTTNNLTVDDVVGHGTAVAEIAAGTPFQKFAGGIAPESTIVSARIIDDKEPTDDGSGNGNQAGSADADYLGRVNDALMLNHVRVMNNSWGGLYWDATATATTQSFHDAYAPFIAGGGLVVFAAGNDSKANPSDNAALPSRAADLARGWLAVVALDSNNPTTLASYSNQCGSAMSYCLAAPGDVIVSGQNDTQNNPSYFVYEGTSLAAPQVSGAAAVVWSAFPYFTNDNVRQTLLGTATDLGTTGPDATFGYGALNVGKAILGPAQFDWGDFAVNIGTTTSTWANDIGGEGNLVVSGTTGHLTLGGANNYTGLTTVNGGTLTALQPFTGVVQTGPLGTLELGGASGSAVGGNLLNQGTVRMQGNVTVGGNFNQSAGATLSTYIGAVLQVGGTVKLDGNLYFAGATPGYVSTVHQSVLTAFGGVTGIFATVSSAPNVMLSTTVQYASNEVWLDTTRVNVTQVTGVSSRPVTLGSAERVEGAFTQLDAAARTPGSGVSTDALLGAAMIQQAPTAQVAQKSLESLSGQLHAASAAMTLEAIDEGNQALSSRMASLASNQLAGAWTQRLGYSGGMSRGGYGNVGVDVSGFLVGQDHKLGASGIVGFALSQSQGLGQLAESVDQGRSHATEASAYLGTVRDRYYAMGRVGLGQYRETMYRGVQLGEVATGVSSNSQGHYAVAYGESGMRLSTGAVSITPYADLEYDRIDRGGFSETGAAGFGLTADGQVLSRWQAGAGLRAGRDWLLPSGGRVSLNGHVAWQHAFATQGDVFAARFTGIDSWGPVGGIGLARNAALVGATLDWSITPRSGLKMSLDQRFGDRDSSKMAMVSYTMAF
ncbi:S8 family serine peptidase [Pinirhizobacter sp.]|uniref:S8 family serine peptidase n=1 Tax=Pinirhizobacter sp. TaxID=2950432 RepID=UPI002F427221